MNEDNQEITAPILVRLQTKNARCSPRKLVEDIKQNLTRILNTRLPLPTNYTLRTFSTEALELIHDSTINFGIADINSLNLGDETMDKRFCDSIKLAVKRFEPRIKNTQIEFVSTKHRFVTIKITGQLKIPPFSEINFETGLASTSSNFSTAK